MLNFSSSFHTLLRSSEVKVAMARTKGTVSVSTKLIHIAYGFRLVDPGAGKHSPRLRRVKLIARLPQALGEVSIDILYTMGILGLIELQ